MIDERLAELGITLPEPPAPAGSYAPVAVVGRTAVVSGQIPVEGGRVAYRGRVTDANIGEARKAARLCAVNVLAQLRAELGSLDRVSRIASVTGFVNSGPEFERHPMVVDAASDLLTELFGGRGRHARVAVGASGLPLGAMAEVAATAELT